MKHIVTLAYSFILSFALLFVNPAEAKTQIINLIVAYKQVNFTGTPAQAISVNNQIPGPTLHLKEGQAVLINVFNRLNVGTTIPGMDCWFLGKWMG